MKLTEFQKGEYFYMSGKRWRCTDIGTRTVIAICMDPDLLRMDKRWFDGPPYAVNEQVLDEYDQLVCTPQMEVVTTST